MTKYGRSPWIDQFPKSRVPAFPRQRGAMKTGVVIVGGGLTGCATGYAFAAAGVKVVLLEAEQRVGKGLQPTRLHERLAGQTHEPGQAVGRHAHDRILGRCDGGLGGGQNAVHSPEHRERQDDLAVIVGFVVAPQEIGDGPNEILKLLVGRSSRSRRGRLERIRPSSGQPSLDLGPVVDGPRFRVRDRLWKARPPARG